MTLEGCQRAGVAALPSQGHPHHTLAEDSPLTALFGTKSRGETAPGGGFFQFDSEAEPFLECCDYVWMITHAMHSVCDGFSGFRDEDQSCLP